MRYFIQIILGGALAGSALFVSCRQPKGATSAAVADTSAVSGPVELVRYPDTTFASVEALSFEVKHFVDSTEDVSLTTLEDMYEGIDGVLTFRGGPRRDMPRTGTLSGRPSSINIEWSYATAVDTTHTSLGVWYGSTGWSGQPLYLDGEIIFGSLAHQVYFLDFETGRRTRNPIDVTNNIKGTVSLDPEIRTNLYVGQGIPRKSPFGALVVDLESHSVSHVFDRDPDAWRRWGAYDSSPLVAGGWLFRPGENGTLYKLRRLPGRVEVVSTLKFSEKGRRDAAGMEASIAVSRNYGYVADNRGHIVCVNLDNMQPVWHVDNHDDTDASIVIEEVDGVPYLYTCSEVDKQGASGKARFLKLNGLDGSVVWEHVFDCTIAHTDSKQHDGGMFSTPLLGRGNCSDLIFTTIITHKPKKFRGDFVALDRSDGHLVYSVPLRWYAWSSPVGFLDGEDNFYVFAADCSGYTYMFEGRCGDLLAERLVGDNFESSPVVVDDCVVVGSRGKMMYKLRIK